MDAFDGGLNNKYEPPIIQNNEAQSCANVVFTDVGAVQTRQGYTPLNTARITSDPCDGLFTANWNNGNQSILAAFGTDLMVLSGPTFQTVGSAEGTYTTGTHKNFVMNQNLVFIGNGSTPTYTYE